MPSVKCYFVPLCFIGKVSNSKFTFSQLKHCRRKICHMIYIHIISKQGLWPLFKILTVPLFISRVKRIAKGGGKKGISRTELTVKLCHEINKGPVGE